MTAQNYSGQQVSKPRVAPAGRARVGRTKEIFGVLVMALAALLSLAILTYDASDDTLTQGNTLKELFIPAAGTQVANALGPVGARLAQGMVSNFFGYATLLLTGLLFVWGYVIMRRRRLRRLLLPSLVTALCMVYLATLLGRIDASVSADVHLWAGALGQGAAGWMRSVFGSPGSYAILALFVIVALLLAIDGDIQRSLDRLENLFRTARKASAKQRRSLGERIAQLRRDAAHEKGKEQEAWDTLGDASPDPAHVAQEEPKPPVRSDLEMTVYAQVEEEKASVIQPKGAIVDKAIPYAFPAIDLLDAPGEDGHHIDFDELEENKRILLDKLAVYNIEITDINAIVGPTVTLYELAPAAGVKISRIKSLEDDLAMAMAARGIRMIAPIPGKSVVGVEIPNRRRELVRLHSILGTAKFRDARMELPVALGKTIEGEVFLQDLTKMPHLLIAGATGSGKSVGLNTLIAGLLYACHPSNLKFVMVDPKKIELQQYRDLLDHYLAVPEDADDAIITDVADALGVLRGCEREMEERYNLLSDAQVRGMRDYNKQFHRGSLDLGRGHKHLPYIVIIIDELADLMMTAGKDIEAPIARLAQMARAVGIHLVLATQRPSVDVITGLIKANFPSRVAFQVASKIDARTILDQNGAERLVGNGDMLYMYGSRLLRLQGPFVSVDEVDRLMDYIRSQPGPGPYILPSAEEQPQLTLRSDANGEMDELFEEAARVIVRSQQGSVSLLQRKLSVGYTRAARIVDQLEEIGVVGAFVGSKAREVLVSDESALDQLLGTRAE